MKKPNYGNWVPMAVLRILWIITVISMILFSLFKWKWNIFIGTIICGALSVIFFIFALYMTYSRYLFSTNGKNAMQKVYDYILNHLDSRCYGKAIDIGCGAGALSIKLAKKYKNFNITGVDYWGTGWDYAKNQCETNARIEGVSIDFQKQDAGHMTFKDESFDVAVSNFVFHEVRTVPDKRNVIREALRVVKKGGAFVFHDLFKQKKLYGNMDDFIEILKKEGIKEIHYIKNTEDEIGLPNALKTPWMLKNLGLIYGIK